MNIYTLTVTWRDGQTLVGQLRTDDPQRFLRALSRDSEIVEAHAMVERAAPFLELAGRLERRADNPRIVRIKTGEQSA